MIIFQNFLLTVVIPLDNNYETVCDLMKTSSYRKTLHFSESGPHLIEYVIGPLKELGVNNWKTAFQEIFEQSPYRISCNFEVTQVGDY